MATKTLVGKSDLPPPWQPVATTIAEMQSIKALIEGKATADQQAMLVKWIEKATAVAEMEFRPGDDRASAFAAGKRFVGLQFFTLAKTYVPAP